MSKGISQIATAAIYVGVTVSAISAALTAGVPAIQNMQEAASVRQAQQFMQKLDSNVQTVVAEGEGSTRTIRGSFDRGRLYFDNETETLVYELRTDANVVSPQVSTRRGNIVLSSSANVEVNKTKINNTPCYRMENEHIKACIKNIGNSSDYDKINVSELLVQYAFKKEDGTLRELDANLSVELNGENATSHGQGYTRAAELGQFIGTGEVRATISSDYGFTYDIVFQLPTGADFLQIDVQNFR